MNTMTAGSSSIKRAVQLRVPSLPKTRPPARFENWATQVLSMNGSAKEEVTAENLKLAWTQTLRSFSARTSIDVLDRASEASDSAIQESFRNNTKRIANGANRTRDGKDTSLNSLEIPMMARAKTTEHLKYQAFADKLWKMNPEREPSRAATDYCLRRLFKINGIVSFMEASSKLNKSYSDALRKLEIEADHYWAERKEGHVENDSALGR